MEVEDIIQDIINQEDEELKQQQDSKNKEEAKKAATVKIKKISQYGLAGALIIILVMMAFSWFNMGGNATYKGFVRIPNNMVSEEFTKLDSQGRKAYMGVYIEASPIELISYVSTYFKDHAKMIDENGKEKISILAWVHVIFIYGYIVMAILVIISTIFLFIPKEFKWIKAVKYMGFISLGIFIINYLLLKVAALNMFVLKAYNELRALNGFESVHLTQKGIAVNKDFYPYFLTVKPVFFVVLVLIMIWIITSIIIDRINTSKAKEIA